MALLGCALAVAFEAYGTLTAMPAAAEDLGRIDLYAWVFTSFIIAQVLAIVLAGRAVDRMGPVLPMGVGIGIFILGLLGAGFAPTMELLLASRFVQGFGAGALNLSFMVVVARAYGLHERAWLISLLSFCWMLPSFVGPPISAWITTRFGWHWVFLGVVPFLVVVSLPGVRPLMELQRRRPEPHANPSPVPVWAAIAAATGVALVQLAGQRLDRPGLVAAVVGLVVLGLGLPRLMPPGFSRLVRGLPAVMTTRGLASGAFFAAETFVPLLLIEMHGFDLAQAGLFVALGATGWTIGSFVQASRRLRIRRDQIIHLGASLQIAGLATMAVAAWLSLSWLLLAVGLTICGLAMGLLVSSTSLATMQISESHQIGRNTSSLQVAEGLGNSLVTGLSGAIFAALHLAGTASAVFTPIYLVCSLVAAFSLVSSVRIGPVRNESAEVG